MRQRGNQFHERLTKTAPHVLEYEVELIIDGRTLDRPVNYALVRVIPFRGKPLQHGRYPRLFGLASDREGIQ